MTKKYFWLNWFFLAAVENNDKLQWEENNVTGQEDLKKLFLLAVIVTKTRIALENFCNI